MVQPVLATEDFRRILNLPRRDWDEHSTELAIAVTMTLRTANGTMTLRPVQAQALVECAERGGLFAPIPVGGGKTLLSLLLPVALGATSPLLIIPAKLQEKTYREWAELRLHWQVVRHLKILTYEALSRVNQAEFLNNYRPDLVICDEAHKVRNKKAAVTRRLFRYLNSPAGKQAVFVALSGTISKRSLLDYHHIISRTHGMLSPLPRSVVECDNWADALDNRVIVQRPHPGPLVRLYTGNEILTNLEKARIGYQKRLVETPAVITLKESRIGTSLSYTKVPVPQPRAIREALERLRDTWETPDGWPLSDPMSIWRHGREILLGFYYVWEPRPPRPWLEARKGWSKFVRDTLKNSRTLDSELMVVQAYPDAQPLKDWRAVRDTFEPLSVPAWLDEGPLQATAARVSQGDHPIIWCEHNAFGARLSQILNAPFFNQGVPGIEAWGGKTVIASMANAEGKNLQAWRRNIVTSPPPNGVLWEQMVGRTHRPGQEADSVDVEVMIFGDLHEDAITKAKSDAKYIHQSTGHEQKILYGDWT